MGVGRACIVLDWKMLSKMEVIIIIIMLISLLLNQSTTIKAVLYPFLFFGNNQKSIDICCQGYSGISNGFNSPGVLSQGFFAC